MWGKGAVPDFSLFPPCHLLPVLPRAQAPLGSREGRSLGGYCSRAKKSRKGVSGGRGESEQAVIFLN